MHNQAPPARTPLLFVLLLAMLAISNPSAIAQSSAEQALLDLANQARAQHNLPPLRWDGALAIAARNHLRWVVRGSDLRHQYLGEPDLATRGANAGARFSTISENIAGHGTDPQSLQQSWMASPVHHRLVGARPLRVANRMAIAAAAQSRPSPIISRKLQ